MKISLREIVAVSAALAVAVRASATIHYVNLNSTNPAPPYTDWTTAAVNIQDAINVASAEDTILVTNGIYMNGGYAYGGGPTNVVSATVPLTIQSVNGPGATIIQGVGLTLNAKAVRCVFLTNNATLSGFTLRYGSTLSGGLISSLYGGAIYCASTNSFVSNCIVISNNAESAGCVYSGSIYNCLLAQNGVSPGLSAVASANLYNCTVISNYGVGANQCKMTNCIVYYNNSGNYEGTTTGSCDCTSPALPGAGNITNAPQLFVDGIHLASGSPCIGTGTNLGIPTDIFGYPWSNPPSIGCAEFVSAPLLSAPAITFTNNPQALYIGAYSAGVAPITYQWFLNGSLLQDNGVYLSSATPNLVLNGMAVTNAGSYQLVASNSFGVTTSAVVTLTSHYVNGAGTNPVSPYINWATAATNIQDAINAASNTDIVLVTNGLYATGAVSMTGVSSNRIAITKNIRVQSVNGPFVTTIAGSGAIDGPSAIRCVWMTNNSSLVGFTLAGGATPIASTVDGQGGGVWCETNTCYVGNCIIASNTANSVGSGAFGAILNNCYISSNTITPAVYGGAMYNCTMVSNSLGFYAGSAFNSILYYNVTNNYGRPGTFAYCCTTPAISGTSNVSAAPSLLADGIHIGPGPCVFAGTNIALGTDLFGNAWSNPPSIGCAEFLYTPSVGQLRFVATNAFPGFEIIGTTITGQPPFSFQWLENGLALTNNGHFLSAQNSNLFAQGVSVADSGTFQLVVSNSYGVVTSAPVQIGIHFVDLNSANPQPPYLTLDTAATNIQNAIDAAAPGEIVLVDDGLYGTGGETLAGGPTNRVVINKPILVISANGWSNAIIQGAFDPSSKDGPAAVRCVWMTNNAVLAGFTVRNGGTLNSGSTSLTTGAGAGVWCSSSNATVMSCFLTNNVAAGYGGAFINGSLYNSLVAYNTGGAGGGAAYGVLHNCTVVNNQCRQVSEGAGVTGSVVLNSIVDGNFDAFPVEGLDNYASYPPTIFSNSCSETSYGGPSGNGNLSANELFVDLLHLALNSPCRGAGSTRFVAGADFEGNTWSNPPSMGCSEIVPSQRTGPLSASFMIEQFFASTGTNALIGHTVIFSAAVTGLATYSQWNWGDGTVVSNAGYFTSHVWSQPGNYTVTFTVFNDDNSGGVSTNTILQLQAPNPAILTTASLVSNQLVFQFNAETNANYVIQYTTNLTPPVAWATLQSINFSSGGSTTITDAAATNAARFYRIKAQ